ncbi:hypothetical protein ILYODFUR_001651, partial [Ilyodon furcidens]
AEPPLHLCATQLTPSNLKHPPKQKLQMAKKPPTSLIPHHRSSSLNLCLKARPFVCGRETPKRINSLHSSLFCVKQPNLRPRPHHHPAPPPLSLPQLLGLQLFFSTTVSSRTVKVGGRVPQERKSIETLGEGVLVGVTHPHLLLWVEG